MIRHIVALDQRRGIARSGVQPWKLPIDERYFADMTKLFGGVVLMGRKTYEVIGRPLPGRHNFVLTHNADFRSAGVTVVHELDSLLAQHADIWVIGGAQIYRQTLGQADELYITEIDADYGCDTFYPEYLTAFEAVQRGDWQQDGDTRYRFMVYRPKPDHNVVK